MPAGILLAIPGTLNTKTRTRKIGIANTFLYCIPRNKLDKKICYQNLFPGRSLQRMIPLVYSQGYYLLFAGHVLQILI